ncbi:MAG: NHL repeat-containing protein [bacterium]
MARPTTTSVQSHLLFLMLPLFLLTACGGGEEWGGRLETVDGVSHLYNPDTAAWGMDCVPLVQEEVLGGTAGPEEALLSSPVAVAVGTDGTRYVLDQADHRVLRFDGQGDYLGSFGREGEGPGEFLDPADLALLEDGTLVVTDYGNGRVGLFDAGGTFLRSFRAGAQAGQVAEAGNGLLYITSQPRSMMMMARLGTVEDEEPALVEQYDLQGAVTDRLGTPVDSEGVLLPRWKNKIYIASAPDGALLLNWMLDDRIQVFSPGGELIRVVHRPVAFEPREPTEETQGTPEGGMSFQFEFDILAVGMAVRPDGEMMAVTTALDPTDFRFREEQEEDPRPSRWAIDLFDDAGRWLARYPTGEEMPAAVLDWGADGLYVINHQGDASVRRFSIVQPQ